ncbi:MAG: hypothetical protein GY940_23640 [bacterium]|nr:hypothetical protein [bacterium]
MNSKGIPIKPGDAARDVAEETARKLAEPGGVHLLRQLQMQGLIAEPGSATPPRTPTNEPPLSPTRPISIWQPVEREGETVFIRPDPLPLGDHYACRSVLEKKKQPGIKRIAFFGESAAAGYLYAPHLTPAKALEEQLREISGPGSFEVVDFARTNETIDTMLQTVTDSLQLAPDLMVIFTGNNWNLLETPEVSPYFPSLTARQDHALALREWGISGPARIAGDTLAEKAEAAFARIGYLTRGQGIPVILVLPEVNLRDWESCQPVMWLAGDGIKQWYETYEKCLQFLEGGNYTAAVSGAKQLLELDGGTCPTTQRILANACLGLGREQESHDSCRAEIDADRYSTLCFLSAPRATTEVGRLLESSARAHGFSIVDLPAIFRQYTGSPIQGRRMFLDYCHLTKEGIKVAMAAVTGEVLRLSGEKGDKIRWSELIDRLPDPVIKPEAEAVALFGAAIHTAHRHVPTGAKEPFLEYWCREALRKSPGIESAMMDFIAAGSAPCQAVLTAAQQRNLESPYRLLNQHGRQYHFLDFDVIEALCRTLEPTRGPAVRDEIYRMLYSSHGIKERGRDLLFPLPYLWSPLRQFYPGVMKTRGYTPQVTYRSPWPVSDFCLVCDFSEDIVVELTLRLPLPRGVRVETGGIVVLFVNGLKLCGVSANGDWQRYTIPIGRHLLKEGMNLNRLTLRWPMPPPVGEDACKAAISRLEQGIEADLHPVFGEMFSFRAGKKEKSA